MVVSLTAMIVLSRSSCGQSNGAFVEPQSTLLFGGNLLVVTPTGSFAIPKLPGSFPEISFPLPALAPGADRVASSLRLLDDSRTAECDPSRPECGAHRLPQYKSVMGVYSLRDKTWKLYGDLCFVVSAVFSPNGKKIAFKTKTRDGNSRCDYFPDSAKLMILDLETGQFTPIPDSGMVRGNAQLSWSPDGKYLAAEFTRTDTPQGQIVSIEIGSGAQKVIADGIRPSWSPKGDWIAYNIHDGKTCMLIHPDGTGAKMVLDLQRKSGGWIFYDAAVWSPNEENLLLNEEQIDGHHYDVTMLDLASGKVTTKSKDGASVLGWVAEKP